MNQHASLPLKLSYCVVLLGMVLPFGLAQSGWVAMATGGNPVGVVPLIGPLLFLVVGIYRVFLVARVPGTLNAPAVSGISGTMRTIGVFLIYAGVLITVLSWVAGPLMRTFMRTRTESGAEFFVVGVYLALAGGVGILGLLMFEFSRLRAFERQAQRSGA